MGFAEMQIGEDEPGFRFAPQEELQPFTSPSLGLGV
jgi:hypothetical protein